MKITVAEPIIALYDTLGYGCFTINLAPGTQEVDDKFGAFIIENYDGVVNADIDPAAAAAIIQEQIAALQAQLAKAESAQEVEVAEEVAPEVAPVEETPEVPAETPSEEAPVDAEVAPEAEPTADPAS